MRCKNAVHLRIPDSLTFRECTAAPCSVFDARRLKAHYNLGCYGDVGLPPRYGFSTCCKDRALGRAAGKNWRVGITERSGGLLPCARQSAITPFRQLIDSDAGLIVPIHWRVVDRIFSDILY